jgi:hypothetical protein
VGAKQKARNILFQAVLFMIFDTSHICILHINQLIETNDGDNAVTMKKRWLNGHQIGHAIVSAVIQSE